MNTMWKIDTKHLCVAISGLSGCGNTSVSKMLATTLGVECINYTLRNLAKDENISFEEIHTRAEKEDKWDLLVDKHQVELSSRQSCVIGSRLAIWIIPHASFKVYLDVDEAVRAGRIQKRESGSIEEVQVMTRERDLGNHKRYMNLYQIDVDQYKEQTDLLINANTIGVEEIVNHILRELERRKLIRKI